MAAKSELSLLGTVAITLNEKPVSRRLPAKSQALQCYLAVTGRRHSREKLLFDDDDTLERVAVEELAPLSAMYIDFIGRLDRVTDPLLRFNLNVWTVIITAVLLVPLATLSAAHWPRKEAQ